MQVAPGSATRQLSPRAGCLRLARYLGVGSWLIIASTPLVVVSFPGRDADDPIRVARLAMFATYFVLVTSRLVLTALASSRRPTGRRTSLLLLAAGIGLWAAGSVTITAEATSTDVAFPSTSEVLFITSYLFIAGFLVADAAWARTSSHRSVAMLEAAVVFGGGACLTCFAVLTPLQQRFEVDGVELLVAALLPMLDLTFAALVATQAFLGHRERSWRTAGLVAGFLLLGGADAALLLDLGTGVYLTSVVADVVWGCGFALLVESACRRPRQVDDVRGSQVRRPAVLLTASAIALAVLVLSPTGVVGWATRAPGALTLVCAGALLAASLRQANRATEAFRLSRTDELTGLPNRRAAMADLTSLVRGGRPLAFLLLDLDGFKDINDSLGHGVGDDVLVLLAGRLCEVEREGVRVARLGGDEFAVIVQDDDDLVLHELALLVRESLGRPLVAAGLEMVVRASVGIAVRAESDESATDLVRRADVAMYEAKASRAGTVRYDAAYDGFSRERLQLTESLRHAVTADEFELWYQPQISAASGALVGLEALLRWRHPVLGLVSPVDFLEQARRSGLMPAISEVVLREVVDAATRWYRAGLDLHVSFNCAPPELLGGTFLTKVAEVVARAGLPADLLVVEVTEDSFLADPYRSRERLLHLRTAGVQVSIDDYGTGFSSLAYLRDLPLQELKIDKSFVATMLTDHRSRVIVETTTTMAHAMGLRLVAEGVEDGSTARELRTMGVDVLQGYGIARPMPQADVAGWAERWVRDGSATVAGVPLTLDLRLS